MTDLTKLSAAKIEALAAKRYAARSAACRALINAGFGEERHSETRKRAAETHDPLAVRSVEASGACDEVWAEMDARKRYHGSLKPIKRNTSWS